VLYQSWYADIINISIMPVEDTPIYWGADSSEEQPEVLSAALRAAKEASGAPIWHPTGRQDGSVLCVREIRCVTLPFLDHMGYLVIRVNFNKIVQDTAHEILSMQDYQINIYQQGTLFYPPPGRQEEPLPRNGLFENAAAYDIRTAGGRISFLVYSPIKAPHLSWDLVLSIPYGDVFRALVTANTLFIVSVVAAVVISLALSRFMFRGINRHLRLLHDKMDRVRHGDLEPFESSLQLAGDELGLLNRYFDDMRADFKKAIEDNYIKELLLAQTQLQSLETFYCHCSIVNLALREWQSLRLLKTL
jgi:two-component system sensor histidine kinase YesM